MFEYFFLWVKTTNFKLLRLVFFTNKETRNRLRVLASEAQTVLESVLRKFRPGIRKSGALVQSGKGQFLSSSLHRISSCTA